MEGTKEKWGAKKLVLSITLLSVTVAIFITFTANIIVSIIFGAEFISSATVLKIYIWSNVGIGINIVIHYILIAEKMSKYIALSAFLGMSINIILNLILIPKFGMSGAALASAVSYLVPVITLLVIPRTKKILLSIMTA